MTFKINFTACRFDIIQLKGSVHKHENSFYQEAALLQTSETKDPNLQYRKQFGLEAIYHTWESSGFSGFFNQMGRFSGSV